MSASGKKSYFSSLTIRGLMVTLMGLALNHFGLPIPPEVVTDTVIEAGSVVVQMVGLATAAFGRVRATQPLG